MTPEQFEALNREIDEATSFSLAEMQLLSREDDFHESDRFEFGMDEYQDFLYREGY